jgi:hypothetical protein
MEVADLISEIEGADLKEGQPDPKGAYTRDAHVKWRRRKEAVTLLDGPSNEVAHVLEEMEQELARKKR